MGIQNTKDRLALAPNIQHHLRFGRARLLSALIRAYADLETSEKVLDVVMSQAERRFSSGSLPPNADDWLRRHCLKTTEHQSRKQTLRFIPQDPMPLMFAIVHPAMTTDSQDILFLELVCGLNAVESRAVLGLNKSDWLRRYRIARRAALYSVSSDVRSFAVRNLERIAMQRDLLYRIFDKCRQRKDLLVHLRRIAEGLTHYSSDLQESIGLLAWMELESVCNGLKGDLRSVDRSLWNTPLIGQALSQLSSGLEFGEPGPHMIRAQISACHLASKSWESTDFNRIVQLYKKLLPTGLTVPMMLDFAEALYITEGAEAGLAVLNQLDSTALRDHQIASKHAALLCRLGLPSKAFASFQRALSLANPASQDDVLRSMAMCQQFHEA